jgi:hypothetical protein
MKFPKFLRLRILESLVFKFKTPEFPEVRLGTVGILELTMRLRISPLKAVYE